MKPDFGVGTVSHPRLKSLQDCQSFMRSVFGKSRDSPGFRLYLSPLRGKRGAFDFQAGIRSGVGFVPAPVTSSRNGGLFGAFARHPERNLSRGRFGFVSPHLVPRPFLHF